MSQSHQNWELLIVDDHSEDASFDMVEAFAATDNRIKLYKNKKHGIIEALRLAFNKSSGDYITRMDSDDIMMPHKLDILLSNLLDKGKQNVAIGLVEYFSKDGIGDGYKRYEAWLNALTIDGLNYSEIYKECVIPSPCWMIHKQDLISCGAFSSNRYPEDYDLAFRFYKHQMTCIPCDTVLHRWRDYESRASRTDEHYTQNYFLEIKLHYFLELDYDVKKTLVIWGAGYKGKKMARLLIERNIEFIWICNNPKKIGKHIYNNELHDINFLNTLNNMQVIVTVANPDSQRRIRSFLSNKQLKSYRDYFFFC